MTLKDWSSACGKTLEFAACMCAACDGEEANNHATGMTSFRDRQSNAIYECLPAASRPGHFAYAMHMLEAASRPGHFA